MISCIFSLSAVALRPAFCRLLKDLRAGNDMTDHCSLYHHTLGCKTTAVMYSCVYALCGSGIWGSSAGQIWLDSPLQLRIVAMSAQLGATNCISLPSPDLSMWSLHRPVWASSQHGSLRLPACRSKLSRQREPGGSCDTFSNPILEVTQLHFCAFC